MQRIYSYHNQHYGKYEEIMAKQLSLLVSSIFSIKRKNCFALLLSDAILPNVVLIKTGIRPISFHFKDISFSMRKSQRHGRFCMKLTQKIAMITARNPRYVSCSCCEVILEVNERSPSRALLLFAVLVLIVVCVRKSSYVRCFGQKRSTVIHHRQYMFIF